MSAIEQGAVFGRLEVLARIPDGRYRLRCRGCRSECTVASAAALQRGLLSECFDCHLAARKAREQRQKEAQRAAPRNVAPIRVRRDECGWALRQEAA